MAFFLHFALFFFARICATQPVFVNHVCMYQVGNFTSNSTYKTNLDHVLSSIATAKDSGTGFYNFSYGQSSELTNAMALCRGDTKPDVCRSCLNDSIYFLTRLCPKQKEGIGWYDNCMLRYSSRRMFGTMEAEPMYIVLMNNDSVIKEDLFKHNLRTLLYSLKDDASSGDSLRKYAAGDIFGEGLGRIYALLQCTPDLSQIECDACLDSAIQKIPACCSVAWRLFSPSCNVRYQMSPFFDTLLASPPLPLVFVPSSNTMSSEDKKKNVVHTTIVIALPFVVVSVFTIGIYMFLRSRKLRGRVETTDHDEISPVNFLQYDFKTIRDATDDFAISNKLGQGGFGAVYKVME